MYKQPLQKCYKCVSLWNLTPKNYLRPLPRFIVTWAWSLAKGQYMYMYMVSWLLTGTPPPTSNKDIANIGLINPEVAGSNPTLVNFSLFIQNLSKLYPVSFPCGSLHDIPKNSTIKYIQLKSFLSWMCYM